MNWQPFENLPSRRMSQAALLALGALAASIIVLRAGAGEVKPAGQYKVLAPVTEENLTVFPVVAERTWDTNGFLTLDEGIRSGEVVVTEQGSARGLVRPRPDDGPWPAPRPDVMPVQPQAQVNQLVLENHSDRPLLLLAGEIVTGGRQDRVIGKDRIVPAHGEPIALGVFCVEPHRWTGDSEYFKPMNGLMAQPSVRLRAMASKNQQEVWDEVNRTREQVEVMASAAAAPPPAPTSSLAGTMQSPIVVEKVGAMALPIERTYEKLAHELRSQKAVGAVVAVNGELIWADAFASQTLLEKYWPKLIRSYAAEAIAGGRWHRAGRPVPSVQSAQAFLDDLNANREVVERQPGVYRNAELTGADFTVFVLSSLVPGLTFDVHVAKMKQ
ncbi:MAG: DUF6569 family protein [Bryobacteraceae bacterium]|jgi:hypothetical protein